MTYRDVGWAGEGGVMANTQDGRDWRDALWGSHCETLS